MDAQLTALADLVLRTLDVNADVRNAGASAAAIAAAPRARAAARRFPRCAAPATRPPRAAARRLCRHSAATSALSAAERSPSFGLSLLSLSRADAFDGKVRLLAATCFKNLVRRNWSEAEPDVISGEDREAVKKHLVELMCTSPPLVQRQVRRRAAPPCAALLVSLARSARAVTLRALFARAAAAALRVAVDHLSLRLPRKVACAAGRDGGAAVLARRGDRGGRARGGGRHL